MNCYFCDSIGHITEAVAICHHCGVGLCREHLDQGLLAERPSGLFRHPCTHNIVGRARRRQDNLRAVEASW